MRSVNSVKAIDKLEELLSKWEEPVSKRDRPKNLTLLMIREMQRIYFHLKNGEKAYFLLSDLVPYLEKCGINVDSDTASCGLNYIASVTTSNESIMSIMSITAGGVANRIVN